MWVECTVVEDPLLAAARKRGEHAADGCFSAYEVAADLSIGPARALAELARLQVADRVGRIADDWSSPASPFERWTVIEHALTPGRRYEVLGLEAGWYLILDDDNRPVLFDPSLFVVLDVAEPEFWVRERDEDGAIHAGPADWAAPGFFEDWHDGVREARDRFREGLRRLYPTTWAERGRHA